MQLQRRGEQAWSYLPYKNTMTESYLQGDKSIIYVLETLIREHCDGWAFLDLLGIYPVDRYLEVDGDIVDPLSVLISPYTHSCLSGCWCSVSELLEFCTSEQLDILNCWVFDDNETYLGVMSLNEGLVFLKGELTYLTPTEPQYYLDDGSKRQMRIDQNGLSLSGHNLAEALRPLKVSKWLRKGSFGVRIDRSEIIGKLEDATLIVYTAQGCEYSSVLNVGDQSPQCLREIADNLSNLVAMSVDRKILFQISETDFAGLRFEKVLCVDYRMNL